MPTHRNAKKVSAVQEVHQNVGDNAFVMNFTGMSSNDMNTFRTQARNLSIYTKVCKNTLLNLSIKDTTLQIFAPFLKQQSIMLIPKEDNIGATAALIAETIKNHKTVSLKCIAVSGQLYDLAKLNELALLPDKQGSLSLLVLQLLSPIMLIQMRITQISQHHKSNTED